MFFRDITAFKAPLEGGQAMMSNLSKFAKLAWTMTRSRQNISSSRQQQQQLMRNGAVPSAAAANASPTAAAAVTAANGGSGGGGAGYSDLPKPAFLDSLPEYKHDPPKTPPHILLHYSTFKVGLFLEVY